MVGYKDEELMRIGEEHVVTLMEIIHNEQHNLDLFNLEVAKFRLKHGMSSQLIQLYGAMGKLSHYLIGLERGASRLRGMWEDVVCLFQGMQDKEEK